MKKFLLMLLPLAALVTGCRYDDSEVWEELNNHEQRILALEKTINTDLVNLQGIVGQLENMVYVSTVTPTANGFTLTFTDGKTYTISNGTDGTDGTDGTNGTTPVIGVKQDTDGFFYWTVNGEWLLDADGKKVRTTGDKGEDGQDAVAPKVKLENNKWYISLDNGVTWTEAGAAAVVGESLFKSVALDAAGENVIFTFQDNSTITIPIVHKETKLQLIFDDSQILSILSGETATVDYTIVIPEGETVEFDTFENNGYSVKVTPADATSGTIAVTAPNPAVKGKVLFILTGSKGSSFVKTVTINGDPTMSTDKTEYNVDAKAGELTIAVKANVAYTSEIEAGKTWITAGTAPNKFNLVANETEEDRSANVTFKADGLADVVVKVTQAGKNAIVLVTADPTIEATTSSLDVVITTNAVVTATPDVTWIHIAEPTKAAKTNKTFSFTIDANDTGAPRTGHIDFTAEGVKQTITVTQDPVLLTVADLQKAANGAVSGYFKNVTVSYVAGGYTYIEDETGGIPVYKNGGVGLTAGQVINGTVSGTKAEHGKAPQLTALDVTNATVTAGEAPLTEVTLEALLANYDKYFGRRIKLTDLTVTQAMNATARTGKVKQGEVEYQLYNADKNNALTLDAEDLIDLICFPSSYNDTKQANVFSGLSTYKGKEKPELKFVEDFSLKVGETTTISGSTNSDGALTYSSSNTDVATIDKTTGFIKAVATGTTTLTVSVAETDNFRAATKSATLTVSAADPTYDFENIAALNALVTSESKSFSGKLTNAVVSFVPAANQAVIKDATGSVLVYKSSHGLKQGQTYTGEITVTAILYNSLYSEVTAFNVSFTGDESVVAPEDVTIAQLTGNYNKYQNAYVKVSNLQVTAVSGKNITVKEGDNTYVVYTNFGNATNQVGDVITVTGTITKYNSTEEIKVWKAADISVVSASPSIEASDITGVAAEGVTDATKTITISNADGWTASVTPDGTVVTAASISESTITYTVAANTGEARDGKITVKLAKSGETDVTKDIKVSQVGASSGGGSIPAPETITFSELSLTNGTQYLDPFNGGHFTVTFAGGGNDGKYYDTGSGIRTYGGGTITVASSSYKIKKIEFTWAGSNAPDADVASPTGYSKDTATWTGSANSVVLTRPSGSGHWRLQAVKVTFGE